MFHSQSEYEAYYTPEAKAARAAHARETTERAVAEAWQLCHDGNEDAAREHLRTAGLADEGVDYYIHIWHH